MNGKILKKVLITISHPTFIDYWCENKPPKLWPPLELSSIELQTTLYYPIQNLSLSYPTKFKHMFYVIENCILFTPFPKGKLWQSPWQMMLIETPKQERIKFSPWGYVEKITKAIDI
jgi:hypothetical protein